MKPDIQFRSDIELLIQSFYQKAKVDTLIGHFFTEVMTISIEEHLPIIYEFWSSILLQEGQYKGMLIPKHLELDLKSPITKEHMAKWQELFYITLDEHFSGPIAEDARNRVEIMGQLMLFKIEKSRNKNSIL